MVTSNTRICFYLLLVLVSTAFFGLVWLTYEREG